jgi:hypothetical protein
MMYILNLEKMCVYITETSICNSALILVWQIGSNPEDRNFKFRLSARDWKCIKVTQISPLV